MKTFLYLSFLIFVTEGYTAVFKIAFEKLPSRLDSHLIESADQHIILEHLLMPIVSYDNSGQLKGVAAKNWEISNNHKTFKFNLREN